MKITYAKLAGGPPGAKTGTYIWRSRGRDCNAVYATSRLPCTWQLSIHLSTWLGDLWLKVVLQLPSLTTSSTPHTKQVKNLTYGFVLGPFQFQSTGQNTHLTSKTVILPVLAFTKKIRHTSTQTNEPSFRKLNSPPTKMRMLFFCSPPGQGVMPTNLLPVNTAIYQVAKDWCS